jgi:hypothetical protein
VQDKARNECTLIPMKRLMSARSNGLRLIFRCAQWIPKSFLNRIPKRVRGIYALHFYHKKFKKKKYDVVYIGMASGKAGIRSRLAAHAGSKRKGKEWSHFSIFEVWPNIAEDDISELEGLFREIFRKDTNANHLARQKRYVKLQKVRVPTRRIGAGNWLAQKRISSSPKE